MHNLNTLQHFCKKKHIKCHINIQYIGTDMIRPWNECYYVLYKYFTFTKRLPNPVLWHWNRESLLLKMLQILDCCFRLKPMQLFCLCDLVILLSLVILFMYSWWRVCKMFCHVQIFRFSLIFRFSCNKIGSPLKKKVKQFSPYTGIINLTSSC